MAKSSVAKEQPGTPSASEPSIYEVLDEATVDARYARSIADVLFQHFAGDGSQEISRDSMSSLLDLLECKIISVEGLLDVLSKRIAPDGTAAAHR